MSGTVGPRIPPFTNTYSLDFDGVSDKLLFSSINWGADSFSISMWINPSVLSGYRMLLGGSGYSVGTGLGHYIFGNTVKTWVSTGGSAQNLFTTSAVLSIGTWCHIVLVRNKNVSWDLYINGILTKQSYIRLTEDYTSDESLIARHYNNNSFNYGGKIDEVSIFNYGLLPTEVSDIYNLGTPKNLTSLNPITWYRMGDNGAYKDPQWLIPSNENKDKVSNYSFQLDGVADYIDCGDSDDFSFGNGTTDSPFSVSMWFNLNSFGTNNVVFSKDSGLPNREYAMGFFATSHKLRFFIKDQGGNNQQSIDSTTLFSLDTWYNVICTYDGSGGSNAADGMNIYVNAVKETPTSIIKGTYVAMSNTTAPVNIGQYGAAASFLPAKIDEFSVYNTELLQADVDSIYHSGEPTTISGAIAHWKLAENATLLTNWTVPDEVGSNPGTSVNMNVFDRVGTAPSSSNNALSFNMDLIDRVEDTPATP